MTTGLIQTAATRSRLTRTHLLHTPESFVPTPLPGLTAGQAVVHACADLGARFVQLTLQLDAGGVLRPGTESRFLYVVAGAGTITAPGIDQAVEAGHYAYAPAGTPTTLTATSALTAIMIDKRYEPLAGVAQSGGFVRREEDVISVALNGDPNVQVRALMPPDAEFDFALNTMTYAPGAALSQVEVHYMEHGLKMLAGEGVYRLDESWYPVAAGDFIWMAPFCPQQFVASAAGAKYLIYKNFNRMPA